ncbi:chaperone for protein-folding within the ER, fungal-domain-containing protein [Paraphoma chrysanthemicola]|uniref:Protein ROT1 n=1 Tax=Paraphoma chrysanthemicola TaxID=798071 RepID=A0A8K0VSJ5_9PLEO|nr:chaperone for protein-folding within the ER, fungal-domain-containing protein [Paraphoma chrysanthemicola]
MVPRIAALLLSGVALLHVQAQSIPAPDLVGTWSSKSNSTLTGDGFYDPVNEKFTEPKHTGISYSFSEDGFYESAYYRAVANPVSPKCPKGIIQWQHGSYEKLANGSLILKPIKVDGRQLYSDPCQYKNAIYTRYNTTERFKQYTVYVDPYRIKTQTKRLDLYQADGAPLMPLYLAYSPPKMLPTTTLNPLVTATPAAGKVKRGELPLNHEVLFKRTNGKIVADQWWWFGVFMTGAGGVLYWFF